MRAYVWLDDSYSKARDMVSNLRNTEHILFADLISGPHKAVFVLEANELADLASTVLFKIGKQTSIRKMTVYVSREIS